MITLHKNKDNVLLCHMGKKPVYWHPRKNPHMRLAVEDLHSLNTEKMRDKFKLSLNQAREIIDHLKGGTTPEGKLQSKFFKCKKYIDNSLYTTMDLHGSSDTFNVNYPKKNDSWGELEVVIGGSGSGKTMHLVAKILRNLNGPQKNRRKFMWISNEYLIDRSLEKLKQPRYANYFQGIDVSDESYDNSEYGTPDEFYKGVVEPAIDSMTRGGVVILDDAADSPIRLQLLRKINKMLRTTRHKGVGLAFVLHRIKHGVWSQQSSSSCKYYTLFPKSGKGKIAEFLKDQGLTLREARDVVADYGDCDCRAMSVRLHAPQAFMNEKLLRLF